MEEKLVVRLHVLAHADTKGELIFQTLERGKRLSKTVKNTFSIFCLGILVTLVPGAHIFGILLVIFGCPLAAFVTLSTKSKLISGQGHCPACGERQAFIPGALNLPFFHCCNVCQKQIRVEKDLIV